MCDKCNSISCSCLKGDRGPRGFQGVRGEVGPQGITGDQGVQGIPGIQGVPGICPCDNFEAAKFWTDDVAITGDTVRWLSTEVPAMTTSLTEVISVGTGLFRIDFEMYFYEEGSRTQLNLGIGINGALPVFATNFDNTLVTFRIGNSQPLTASLFIQLTQGDTINPDFLMSYAEPGNLLQLNSLKLFITKVR